MTIGAHTISTRTQQANYVVLSTVFVLSVFQSPIPISSQGCVVSLIVDCEEKARPFQIQAVKTPAQLSVSSLLVRVEAMI